MRLRGHRSWNTPRLNPHASRSRSASANTRVRQWSGAQLSGSSIVTLPAAISRSAVTTSLLSDSTNGRAPLSNCFARRAAPSTSSKRLGMFSRQSSTVIRAIARQLSGVPLLLSTRTCAGHFTIIFLRASAAHAFSIDELPRALGAARRSRDVPSTERQIKHQDSNSGRFF